MVSTSDVAVHSITSMTSLYDFNQNDPYSDDAATYES